MLIVLMGVISVNLAVVNFMPIPVLEGGHMVFLMYEWIRGKPASERVQEILVYVGLACVGSPMLLSIGMDIWRIFNG
jgi:regulator of sigma E protease